MSDLKLGRLRFFLNGPPAVTSAIYDLLVTAVAAIQLRAPADEYGLQPNPIRLDRRSVRQVGFGAEEEVLPSPPQSHPGYRLIQEYFHFPDKFRFIDVKNLEQRPEGEVFDILFLLTRAPNRLSISKDTFVLGCTPIVNLFPKTSEPIRVDHRSLEYRLVGDMRRERTTEIPLLFKHFLQKYSAKFNKEAVVPSQHLLEAAVRYPWPPTPALPRP